MTGIKGPYRVVRVVDERSRTRWHVVNREGSVLVWVTDPVEAYRIVDMLAAPTP